MNPRYEFDGKGIWDNKRAKKVVEVWIGMFDTKLKEREQLVDEMLTLANRTAPLESNEGGKSAVDELLGAGWRSCEIWDETRCGGCPCLLSKDNTGECKTFAWLNGTANAAEDKA